MAHIPTALVTGGSDGIGYQVCRQLACAGTRLIVHAPTPPAAQAAVERLIRDGADPGLLHAVAADYRSLSDVTSLARHLDRRHDRLDLLINNAGAITPDGRTADGFDAMLQVNYLAHYALTRTLGRALNTAGGRVVTVASALHREGRLDLGDPTGTTAARPAQRYADAQLALVLFTRAVAQSTERRVTSVAVHPGFIDTGTFAAVNGADGLPVADGAAHVLHAADLTTDIVNGGYYEGMLLTDPAPAARDTATAIRLWGATARLLGWDYTALRHQTATCDAGSNAA